MVIIKTFDWNRRDFSALLRCEDKNCGHEQKHSSCYDDENYYKNVIPNIKCGKCLKSSNDLGTPPAEVKTKHDPNIVM